MMGWQWNQLDHMQIICTSLQTDNLITQFLQAGCPSCCPSNSIKALKADPSLACLLKHITYNANDDINSPYSIIHQ